MTRIEIELNGATHTLAADDSLQTIVEALNIPGYPRGIAVAVNDRVVSRDDWAGARLHAGDRVEIIRAVQGG